VKPENYLENIINEFRSLKKQAEKAITQVSDKDFFSLLDEESNSIAILMKHLAGNMRSRWTDFLTSDGEKPNRNRDSEFIVAGVDSRDSIFATWLAGWQCLFQALAALQPEDLGKTVVIRAKPTPVYGAIHRQLTHYASHIGQIVLLAKHYAGSGWQTLSVPKGKSQEYNSRLKGK